MRTFNFCFIAFVVGVLAKTLICQNSFNQGERWSKWSAPIDTRTQGWYYQRGIIQYRTNLDTGRVEMRGVE